MNVTKILTISAVFILLFKKDITAQTLQISCEDPVLEYNDHVGNEWGFGVEVNSVMYSLEDTILIPITGISKVRVFVQEIDKYTEEVSQWLEIKTPSMEFGKNYTKNLEFVIQENMGRYSGNSAKWFIKIKYQKLDGRA